MICSQVFLRAGSLVAVAEVRSHGSHMTDLSCVLCRSAENKN